MQLFKMRIRQTCSGKQKHSFVQIRKIQGLIQNFGNLQNCKKIWETFFSTQKLSLKRLEYRVNLGKNETYSTFINEIRYFPETFHFGNSDIFVHFPAL